MLVGIAVTSKGVHKVNIARKCQLLTGDWQEVSVPCSMSLFTMLVDYLRM